MTRKKKRREADRAVERDGQKCPRNLSFPTKDNFQRKSETFSMLRPLESSSSDGLFFALSLPM